MGNFVRAVNGFFEALIPDEAGRFFLLHLPFWGFLIFIGWNILLAVGLYLIWAGIVFGVVPYVTACVFQGVYEQEQYSEKKIGFLVVVGIYLAAILALIGIPGLYLGYIFDVVGSKTFSAAYWEVIEDWWKVFHFYHEFKGTKAEVKELQEFVNGFSFHYSTWQVSFLVGALVIAPAMYWWVHNRARERAWAEELEQSRHETEVRARLEQAEAKVLEMAERQRLNEARKLKDAEAEKEKQKKIQEKINEVKGKDPWDSGFL